MMWILNTAMQIPNFPETESSIISWLVTVLVGLVAFLGGMYFREKKAQLSEKNERIKTLEQELKEAQARERTMLDKFPVILSDNNKLLDQIYNDRFNVSRIDKDV